MKRISIAAACLAALLTLAACSSSGSGGNSSSAPPANTSGDTITIKDFGYSGDLTVKAGAKVRVVNDDGVAHTLTDKATKKFDTGSIDGSGGTGTFTAPDKAGKYPFGCTFHPEMKGTLTVTS